MNTILEFLQKDNIKKILLNSISIEDFVNEAEKINKLTRYYFEKYSYFNLAYLTIKNHPKTYHTKVLKYPHLIKASDLLTHIKYGKEGIYIYQSLHKSQKDKKDPLHDVLKFEKQRELTKEHFPTARTDFKSGIVADVIERVGGIELIDREEGLILIANSSTHIGSDWLAIIKDFDLKIN